MPGEQSIHEVDFCGQVASAANQLFAEDPSAYPFAEARVEGFGAGSVKRKRKDLRFFEPNGKLALCGEVKLPGTVDGRSPYDDLLCQDAQQKAENAVVRYFFTGNVNSFVLWDRSQWDKPALERRVREWKLGIHLANAEDVARRENLEFILARFLPDLLRDLGDIYAGRRRDWAMAPDDIFIRSLESHLDWPVQLTATHLFGRTSRDRAFDAKVQAWLADEDYAFVRNDPSQWRNALDNMAKTLAYVWVNRLIFYKALRARFGELPALELKRSVVSPHDAITALDRLFKQAVERSGDYESLLFPSENDWATQLVFDSPNALDAWRGLLRGLEAVDFRAVPSDVVGRIFQKLIGPEERHRFGQHFTGDDAVDLINAFCIHQGADKVLDPACGSGSFLVRAYYRKKFLSPSRDHSELLSDLFGCDIAVYPAHLATLNLAAREINEEANYPRIARRDFFDTESGKPFCSIPDESLATRPIELPPLDAVVGNPPYVSQLQIGKHDKLRYAQRATAAWPKLRLSGRADLHCYFWPVAAKLLKAHGYFGFLTSSSWLDAEYGFALQGWILSNFRVLAVMESAAEPWFTDARVKTAATILQQCTSDSDRSAQLVRFVRFARPLQEIIGAAPGASELKRQRAVERLRDRILQAETDYEDESLRIIVKAQRDLWNEGVRAGHVLRSIENDETEDDEEPRSENIQVNGESAKDFHGERYLGGKWGRYVRAPDLYFDLMHRFGHRFVPLGLIAAVRRGITSGCDAFFMPRDITQEVLRAHSADAAFKKHAGGAPRQLVETGKLRIIKAGDGSVHAVESEFLAPEVHSLMKVARPVVRASELDRVVLLVGSPMKDLKGTWVLKYLKYGEQATFASKKSRAVPVPERSTCATRELWYDLTGLVKPGIAFWPKSQQYRHVVPANPERIVANCNLYDVDAPTLSKAEKDALSGVLNSTLVGLFKTFYGRFAGTEGNLKTEVVDVNLLEVPDPRAPSAAVVQKLRESMKSLMRRSAGRLVEEQLMACHSPERARRIAAGPLVLAEELKRDDRRALDDAVLELLGLSDSVQRAMLVEKVHEETARHFRAIRVVEIEKMEQRSQGGGKRFSVQELAADAWDAIDLDDLTPLTDWLKRRGDCDSGVSIPAERPARLSESPMFDPNSVYFGKAGSAHVDCQSLPQAKLVLMLANAGLSGWVEIPSSEAACTKVLEELQNRLQIASQRFRQLAESRASDSNLVSQIADQLLRWFTFGRSPIAPTEGDPDEE